MIFNIIFKLNPVSEYDPPYLQPMLESICKDYVKLSGYITEEDWRNWYENPSPKTMGKRFEFYVDHEWVDDLHDFIRYIPKFDCYQMREYFEDTSATRGLIQRLFEIKDGEPNTARSTIECQFIRTLYALTNFWD